MDYDDLAYSIDGRQAPKLGRCLDCNGMVDIEFSLRGTSSSYSTSRCPLCQSERVQALPDQPAPSGNIHADTLQRMQSLFTAFGLSPQMASAMGQAAGAFNPAVAAALRPGGDVGGRVDPANIQALEAAQQGVDVDALMLALLQDSTRKAPPALKSFVDALPNCPLNVAESVEAWLEIEALNDAVPSSSTDTTSPAAISFTLPAFGPRLVSLHHETIDHEDEEQRMAARRQSHGQAELIVADGDGTGANSTNQTQWRERCVVFQRGGITFVEKIRRAQTAGAAAVLVIQTLDQWPYQMSDSTNTSTELAAVFMISKSDGARLLQRLKSGASPRVRWGSLEKRPFCAICREEFGRQENALQLPCRHPFHAECIHPWLAQRNSCPLCRFELPTGDPDVDRRLNQKSNTESAAVRDAAYELLRPSMWG
jgi:hypothetical protein